MTQEKNSHRVKNILLLFLLFLKIGLFTFGGGYAMISLIRREFVDKRRWITSTEFMDMIAISESTPGPLAINSATYVGFKIGGFFGALSATVGVVIPSFVIIYIISLFLERFLALKVVAAAFKGIQVAVAFLILTAGIRLFKEMEKKPLTLIMAGLTFAVMIMLDVLALSFSSVYLILIGAGVGLFVYLLAYVRERRRKMLAPADGKAAEMCDQTSAASFAEDDEKGEVSPVTCDETDGEPSENDGEKSAPSANCDDESCTSPAQPKEECNVSALSDEKKEGKEGRR